MMTCYTHLLNHCVALIVFLRGDSKFDIISQVEVMKLKLFVDYHVNNSLKTADELSNGCDVHRSRIFHSRGF